MPKVPKGSKMWSGRFAGSTDDLMERFGESMSFDIELFRADIRGNIAQAKGLHRAGVLTDQELSQVLEGLAQVEHEIADGTYVPDASLEDIHMAVEARLTEIIGPAGAKIHTGRSRNDQIVLDERIYLKNQIDRAVEEIDELRRVLIDRAEKSLDVFLPGYTHLQQAQPIRLAHYWLAAFWMFTRDGDRLLDCKKRADVMPLGSGALAGSGFAVDREYLTEELGFASMSPNSLDAVSDRDFLIEFVSAAAIAMTHLSRFCEDLIIWSSKEFGFVALDDGFSTGSSMMPQKKNPDSLELIRGKAGRVFGDLMALLTAMKGIPLAYSRDMQEDKEPFFDAVATLHSCLQVFAGAIKTLEIDSERMSSATNDSLYATDVADYLVRKEVPFRDAHRIVGALVGQAEELGVGLPELSLQTFRAASDQFEDDVMSLFDLSVSTDARSVAGGTAVESIKAQLEQAKQTLTAAGA